MQLLLAGTTAEPLFATWISTTGPVQSTLATAQPTDGLFDLAAALSSAAAWVERSRWQPVDIVLLSDLQRVQGGLGGLREANQLLTAAGESRLLIRQVGTAVPNGGILAVHLPLRAVRAGETIDIAATVRADQTEQSFLLELDGRRVAESVAAGAVGSLSRVVFRLTAPAAGLHRGRIVKDSNRLPVDDARPFVMMVWDRVSVLLVHGADRGPAGRGGWRYVAEALDPAATGQTLFAVEPVPSGRLAAGDLSGVDVALFVDPDPLGRQLLGGLLEWLAHGGAAAFCVGDPTLESYLTSTLLPAVGLSARVEYRVRAESGQENVTLQARGHPVFADLDRDALATLGDITWRRYFALDEGDSRVLLAFTSETPALLECRYGEGTILWLPYHFLTAATDLPLSPMFLPLIQRLTAYLAQGGTAGGERDISVGQRPQVRLSGSGVEAGELADAASLSVILGATSDAAMAAELTWRRGVPLLVGPAARQKGFYTFLAGTDTVGVVAAATPASESDPTLWDVDELRTFLATAELQETADLGRVDAADFATLLAGRDISLWLLGLAFLLLCVESYLARGIGGIQAAL